MDARVTQCGRELPTSGLVSLLVSDADEVITLIQCVMKTELSN